MQHEQVKVVEQWLTLFDSQLQRTNENALDLTVVCVCVSTSTAYRWSSTTGMASGLVCGSSSSRWRPPTWWKRPRSSSGWITALWGVSKQLTGRFERNRWSKFFQRLNYTRLFPSMCRCVGQQLERQLPDPARGLRRHQTEGSADAQTRADWKCSSWSPQSFSWPWSFLWNITTMQTSWTHMSFGLYCFPFGQKTAKQTNTIMISWLNWDVLKFRATWCCSATTCLRPWRSCVSSPTNRTTSKWSREGT